MRHWRIAVVLVCLALGPAGILLPRILPQGGRDDDSNRHSFSFCLNSRTHVKSHALSGLDARETLRVHNFHDFRVESFSIVTQDPGGHLRRRALLDRQDNIRIPRPGVLAVII